MQHQPPTAGLTIFAQGPTCCAVCAPRAASRDLIEAEVALRNRSGTDANVEWRVPTGPLYDGRSNPRECPHDAGRRHWLVLRVAC
jgi:hypothetical protein